MRALFIYLCTFLFSLAHIQAQRTLSLTSEKAAYFNALELFEHEKYASAQKVFDGLTANEDIAELTKIEAEYYGALCAMHLFQPDIEYRFQEFIDSYPYHPKSKLAYYQLGDFYYSQGKYDKTITYLEKVDFEQLNKKESYEGRFKLGYSYFMNQDFEHAVNIFDRVKLGNHAYTYAAYYYAGYCHYRNENYDQALQDLNRAEDNEAYAPLIPYLKTNVYYKKEEYERLIEYAKEELSSERTLKNKQEIYLLAGEAHFRLNDYSAAAEYFQNYLDKSKSKDRGVYYRLGISLFKTGQYQESIEYFDLVATSEDSTSQYAYYYLGEAYLQTGNTEYAKAPLEMAARSDYNPEIQQAALFEVSKIQYSEKNFRESIRSIKLLNEKFPNHPYEQETQELLSESYLNTNDYDTAIEYLEGLPALNTWTLKKNYQEVTLMKGKEIFNKGKLKDMSLYEKAISYFLKSLRYPVKTEPQIEALYWKGESHSVRREWSDAKREYASLFKVPGASDNEFYLRGRYGIGYAYFNTDEYDKAKEHFNTYVRETTSKDRFRGDAMIRYADCIYKEKEYKLAIDYYDRAINEKVSNNDYAMYQIGNIYGILLDFEKAYASLNRVLNTFPKSPYMDDALYRKGELKFIEEKYQEAEKTFSNLISSMSSSPLVPEAIMRRAICYTNMNKYQKALDDYDRILNNYCQEDYAVHALTGARNSLELLGDQTGYRERLQRYENCNPDNKDLSKIRYEYALEQYRSLNFKNAAETFKDYLEKYPDSPYATEARFYLADSWYQTGRNEQATSLFEQLLKLEDPQKSEKIYQRLGEMYLADSAFVKSIEYNKKLLNTANSKTKQVRALMGIVEGFYLSNQYDSTIQYADRIINYYNKGYAQNYARLYIAKSHKKQGKIDEAKNELLHLVNTATDVYGAEANFRLGELLHEEEKYEQSTDLLAQTPKKFVGEEYWIGKAFLLISQNYIAQEKYVQAEATLQSLIDYSPEEEIVQKAKEAKEELLSKKNQLLQTEEEVEDDF